MLWRVQNCTRTEVDDMVHACGVDASESEISRLVYTYTTEVSVSQTIQEGG